MADFKTHITVSTAVGIGYGYVGATQYGMPVHSSIIAATLCSVSGMLPDLDSDSGVPLRETTMFASAVVPMLLIDRLQDLGLNREMLVLAAGVVYVAIRFVVAEFFKRFTVHRGMWHSIPAAISAGLIAYLLMHCAEHNLRLYKSLAVFTGFMVHLILDEIWAVEFRWGIPRLKKSFGTAMKFWSSNALANISAYAKLAVLWYLVANDHSFMMHQHLPDATHNHTQQASPWQQPNYYYPSTPPSLR